MPETVTLTLPENFLQPLKRTAKATKQPIEKLLLSALQSSLPPLEGLPKNVIANLTALETLDDKSLQQVMMETVLIETQKAITKLLDKQKQTALSNAEHKKLSSLQHQADLVMLRKARAAVLLRFRGRRIPTIAELH
jgi:hypothetical protein